MRRDAAAVWISTSARTAGTRYLIGGTFCVVNV